MQDMFSMKILSEADVLMFAITNFLMLGFAIGIRLFRFDNKKMDYKKVVVYPSLFSIVMILIACNLPYNLMFTLLLIYIFSFSFYSFIKYGMSNDKDNKN